MSKERGRPVYHGMTKHVDQEGGYALWLPSDWRRIPMADGQQGMLFSPYEDCLETHLAARKTTLPVAVTKDDVDVLRRGFNDGLQALPGVEVESQDETVTSTLITLEARFTFLEGEARRKRWVRVIYWGEGQLLLIAQGATPDDFDYWLPMFYNTMVTVEIA